MNELIVRNGVITSVAVLCKGKIKKMKKEKEKQVDLKKKMKIPESETSQCAEYKIKSNIETMLKKQKNKQKKYI